MIRTLPTAARRLALAAILAFGAASPALAAAPCPIDTRTAAVGSGTVSYNVVGAGPVVLLLHGLFADKEQWSTLACELAAAGYRAIAPDLPGYGKSTGYGLSAYRLDLQVALLEAFAERVGLVDFALGGNSMGGTIAALYARGHPARVRSLAFLGSPLGVVPWHPDLRAAIYRGMNPFVPVDAAQLDVELGLLFVKPPALTDAQKRSLVAPYVEHNRHYVQVWNIVNLYDDVLVQRTPPRVPALIVWGEADRVYSVRGASLLQRRIAGSVVRTLPAAGHLLHMESAAAVAPIYVEFLKNAAASQPREPRMPASGARLKNVESRPRMKRRRSSRTSSSIARLSNSSVTRSIRSTLTSATVTWPVT